MYPTLSNNGLIFSLAYFLIHSKEGRSTKSHYFPNHPHKIFRAHKKNGISSEQQMTTQNAFVLQFDLFRFTVELHIAFYLMVSITVNK